MVTTIDGTNPSITDLAIEPKVRISEYHSRVLTRPRVSAFGETVVIADNMGHRQTTVLVDLEPEIDPNINESFEARRRIRNHPDDK